MKSFGTEDVETICLELIIAKKKRCILFALRPQGTNKTVFFNEICITLKKILSKYDNILLAGDINIDEPKFGSNSSNHLSGAKDVSNLTNSVEKRTCSHDGSLIDLTCLFPMHLLSTHLKYQKTVRFTNSSRSFSNYQNFEIGLSDCHKLVLSTLRASLKNFPRKS